MVVQDHAAAGAEENQALTGPMNVPWSNRYGREPTARISSSNDLQNPHGEIAGAGDVAGSNGLLSGLRLLCHCLMENRDAGHEIRMMYRPPGAGRIVRGHGLE
jgi:hypothetical protein